MNLLVISSSKVNLMFLNKIWYFVWHRNNFWALQTIDKRSSCQNLLTLPWKLLQDFFEISWKKRGKMVFFILSMCLQQWKMIFSQNKLSDVVQEYQLDLGTSYYDHVYHYHKSTQRKAKKSSNSLIFGTFWGGVLQLVHIWLYSKIY